MPGIDDTIKQAVEAETAADNAAAAQSEAATAKNITEAAAAGVAAAQAGAALAGAEAAKTLNEKEGEISWLKQHAEATASSLQNLSQRLEAQEKAVPELLQANRQEILSGVEKLLTPKEPTPPETQNASPENADALAEAERKKKAAEQRKPRRNWL